VIKSPSFLRHFVQIALFLGAIFVFDCLTSYEVNIGPLYIVLAGYAAWQLGFSWGIFFSFLCMSLWALGDYLNGHRFSQMWLLYENAAIRFFTYAMAVSAVFIYKRTLEAHRRRLAMLERLLSVCPGCGCITVNQSGWRKASEFHQQPKQLYSLCPTCAATHKSDAPTDTPRASHG
jgi:hypothetical protein